MRVEAVVAVKHEEYGVIRNGESLPRQREKTSQRRMGEVVGEPVGRVGVDQVFRTDRGRSNAVARTRQNGHPIVTPTKFEMSVL